MINKFKLWLDKKSFCPDLKDLENEELKTLANRLKGDSNKESLTNILEWQHRNIQFWWERWPFDISLKFLGVMSWMLILLIFLPFLQLLYPSKFPIVFILILALVILLIIISVFSNILFLIFYLFLFLPLVYLLMSLALRIPLLAQDILPYTLFYVGCLGAIVLIIVYLVIRYRVFFREKSIYNKVLLFLELAKDTFLLSLPVNKLLDYKLAICRDYAKLTASLIFNIYPSSEIYFVTIPSHVATAVKIGDICYVLDQHLPILTIDRWLIDWNKKKTDIYISKVLRDSMGKPISIDFSKHKSRKLISVHPKEVSEINTEKLTEEIANTLGIAQRSHKDKSKANFETTLKPLKKYAIYYEDNEITKYSLIRAIKNKLESEFCGNINLISKIKISQKNEDFIISVYHNVEHASHHLK